MGRLTCALVLAVALPALGGELEERLAVCQETNAECREDCTTAYGSSFKLREQLGRCLLKCEKRNSECQGRHLELDQAGIDENGYERKRPGQELAEEPAQRPSAPRPRAERRERAEPSGRTAQETARAGQADRPGEKAASAGTPSKKSAPPAAQAETPEQPAPDEDPARAAAKKLMKKGAEEWNPDGD